MGLPMHIDQVRFSESPQQTETQIYAVIVPHGEGF